MAMAGGALGDGESLCRTVGPSPGGAQAEQQAAERSCPGAVVLKVALWAATQQEALSGVTKVGAQGRWQGSPRQPGACFPTWLFYFHLKFKITFTDLA